MKGRQVILGQHKGRDGAALLVDGVLQDLLLDHDAPRPGTIYRARADRPVKGQGGMFLHTPDGSAFLRGVKGLAPGDQLLVQVAGHAERGKAIPVTAKLLFKSRYVIVTPEAPGINISRAIKDEEERLRIRASAETENAETSGYGLILRSSCQNAPDEAITEDVEAMIDMARAILSDEGRDVEKLLEGPDPAELAWREWATGDIIEEPLGEYVSQARKATQNLPSGGSMSVEATRAVVAVDINTGGDTSPAAGLKANLAAAKELPRQLRLKGLGGQVVVDFAPMPKKDRRTLENALRAALKSDEVETSMIGWTQMGLFELSRKRARVPLAEILS